MTQPNSDGKARFRLLDGLRLFAALSVVAYHFLAIDRGQWGMPVAERFQFVSKIAAYGALGVPLFFLISGFVILMSAWGRSLPQFIASRVSRLYPAYWAGVLATTFLIVVITKGGMKNLSVGQVLMNLTMLQEGFGVAHVDGVYWTLFVEFMFYILIGLVVAWGATELRVQAFILLWPLAAVIADRAELEFASIVLVPQYAPLFAGGMAVYLLHAFGHSLSRWLLVGFTAIVATHQISNNFFGKSMVEATGQDLSAVACIAIVLLMFIVMIAITLTPLKAMGPAWLTYAGALTYPVYLIHEYWGWWLIGVLSPGANKWVTLFLAIGLSLLGASLIERFVERPLQPKIRAAMLKSLRPQVDEQYRPQASAK